MRPLVWLLICLLTVVAGSALAQDGRRSAAWTPTDCRTFNLTPPEEGGVDCGYVTVPLRHAAPDGASIQLATVILAAQDKDKRPDPLFMAQGGPGGSTIDTYGEYLVSLPESRPVLDRDIVLWDQRGTLYSKPALMCPEVANADIAAAVKGTENDAADQAAYRTCGERLAAGVGDLSAFNSAENADDIEALRTALGYDSINFYGVSYGTELGQFLMRRHPEHLRSAVLDAVVPLSYNLFTEPAFAMQRIGEKYLDGCAAEPRCATAFPNLRQRYLALIDRLNATPATVQVAPIGGSAAPRPVKLTGTRLRDALYESLYSDVYRLVPLIVDRADRGDYTYVSTLLLPLQLFDTTMAVGMNQTVSCADRGDTDLRKVDYRTILPRLAKESLKDARMGLEICRDWKIGLLPRAELKPLKSGVPTLLLSGDFDPITPPAYAATLLPALSRAHHVAFPTGSHGQAVTNDCSNTIIRRFLDDPAVPPDTSCVATVVGGFVTEADVITVPALRSVLAAHGVEGLAKFALSWVPGLIGVLFLLTAVIVYPVGGLVGLLRKRRTYDSVVARSAPWLAVASALVLGAFFVGITIAVGATIVANENLLAMGAIPARWRGLFVLPTVGAVLISLMLLVAAQLWRRRERSQSGRLYFTLLAVAGAIAIVNLLALGVLGLGRA